MNPFVISVRRMAGACAAAALLCFGLGCGTTGGSANLPVEPDKDGQGTATQVNDVSPVSNRGDGPIEGSSDWLRPGDVVIINFSGVSDPPARVDDRIREDGRIVLPFVGVMEAAGITRSELQRRIHDAYVPKYYRQLTVSVNPDTRFIYVDGEVKRPGNYPYSGQMTVSKAIAAAGGFTDFGNRKKVQLKRGKERPKIINWEKAMRNPAQLDLPVFPEDLIYVPRRWF